MVVVLTATAGFGASTAWSGTEQPKPACCRPALCSSPTHCGISKPSCCRPDTGGRPQAPVSPSVKAPETSAPALVFVAKLDVDKASVSHEHLSVPSVFPTAPPIFSLKSSFLI